MLDASVAIAALLIEDRTQDARTIFRTALNGVVVPALWHLEVGNIPLRAERKGLIRADERAEHIADLMALPLSVDHDGPFHARRTTTDLAMRHQPTLCNAAYLELAVRLRAPLATFVAALVRAAGVEGATVAVAQGNDEVRRASRSQDRVGAWAMMTDEMSKDDRKLVAHVTLAVGMARLPTCSVRGGPSTRFSPRRGGNHEGSRRR